MFKKKIKENDCIGKRNTKKIRTGYSKQLYSTNYENESELRKNIKIAYHVEA